MPVDESGNSSQRPVGLNLVHHNPTLLPADAENENGRYERRWGRCARWPSERSRLGEDAPAEGRENIALVEHASQENDPSYASPMKEASHLSSAGSPATYHDASAKAGAGAL